MRDDGSGKLRQRKSLQGVSDFAGFYFKFRICLDILVLLPTVIN